MNDSKPLNSIESDNIVNVEGRISSYRKEFMPKIPYNISDKTSGLLFHSQSCNFEDTNSLELKGILKKSINSLTDKENEICDLINADEKKNKHIIFEEKEECPSPKSVKSVKSAKLKNEDYSITELGSPLSPKIKERPPSKLYELISKLFLTKKFIRKLRNATVYRKPKWLNQFHFKVINDWSFFFNGSSFQNSVAYEKIKSRILPIINLTKFFSFITKQAQESMILKKITQIILPDRLLHAVFDLIMLFFTIFAFFVIFLDVGFNMDFIAEFLDGIQNKNSIRHCILIIFLLDIIFNFQTAYYEKGELIVSRKKIVENYFKGNFFKDLLSLLYFFFGFFYKYPYEDWFTSFSCLLFLLRMRNIRVIFTRLEDFLFLDENYYNYLSFFKLIIRLLFIAHAFACCWHYIGMSGMSEGPNWLEYTGTSDEIWWKKYIYSFYYVAVVMNTVGFGDISPQNLTEISFTIFFIYFACGVFAYNINSVGMILQNMNKNEREFKRNMNLINGFMRKKQINYNIRTKIRNYLEYIWKEEKIVDHDECLEVINKLSKSLKEELLLNSHGIFLRNFPLFRNNFSENTLRNLTYEMKEINMTPGDIIYNNTDINDNSLYIIRKGNVDLFVSTPRVNDSLTVLESKKKGEYFGEISFFTDQPRETSARCSTFCSLYTIKRERLIEILKQNSEDYEIFCQIKDKITLYNEYESLNIVCNSCKDNNHPTINCPFLHLTISKQRILQKFNFFKPQERDHFQRQTSKKPGARLKFIENMFKAKKVFGSDVVSSENYTKSMVSSKIESSNNLNFEVNQTSSKNSLFLVNSSPRKSIEIKIEEYLNKESIKEEIQENKKKKKFCRSNTTNLVFKDDISLNSGININSLEERKQNIEEKAVQNSNPRKKAKDQNSSSQIKLRQKEKNDESDLSDLSENSSNSSENKKKSSTENPVTTTTTNNLQTDFEKNCLYDDAMKEYIYYFPHNNAADAVVKANGLTLMNLRKKKLSRYKSIKKIWYGVLSNTIKSEDANSTSKKKKFSLYRNTFTAEMNFFGNIEKQRKSSFSGLKLINLIKGKKIGNKKKGIFEKVRSWFHK